MKVMNTVDYLNATEKKGSCHQQRHVRLADADGKPFTSSYREVR